MKLPGKLSAKAEETRERQNFVISLSIPLIIILSLGLAAGVGWSFFMGYMVGKGQNPKTEINQIAGIGKNTAEKIPEDPKMEAPKTETPVMPESGQIPPARQPQPFAAPDGNAAKAWEKPQKNVKETPEKDAPKTAAASEKTPKSPLQKYDYSFQTSAFKTEKEANALKKQLNQEGIHSKIQKSGKVFLVIASLRGTENDAQELRKKLIKMKLGTPVQLAKKPAQDKKKK